MSGKRIYWCLRVMCVTGLTIGGASFALASNEGQAAAEQVSVASYQGFMNNWLYTHSGQSRGPNGAQHDPARDNILSLFQSYGLSAALEPFTYGGQSGENVVATQTGTVYPERIYIIGGHYDSVNNPGADDNASGVALVLEAARILSQYPTDCTIRYIAFDLEELGLYGSHAYVNAHSGEDIRGMISLDMVCYDPNTDHCLLYGRTTSNPIKNALAAAVTEYSGGLTYTINGQLDQSDHAPFEAAGFQACLLIEGEVWNNPYYHTQNDKYESLGYLNFNYAVKMTRSVVGWLVDAAGVDIPVYKLAFSYPEGLPDYAAPSGGTVVRVAVSGVGGAEPATGTGQLHYNVGSGWQAVVMTEVTPNVYDAVLPAAACGTEVQYYFSAQATSGEGYVDPYLAPTNYYAATAAYGITVAYENTFDSNPGWTTTGQWAFGTPTGGGSNNHDPTSGHTGSYVYGYNLAGDYANNLPVRYLTTPAFDCTGQTHVQLEFWRWLGVESNSNYDQATVEASNNGTSWSVIWSATSTGAAVADTAWKLQVFDLATIADNQPTVYIRWGMGPTDSYVTYPGWNVDDVRLTGLLCEPPYPVGDLNCDGLVDFRDINPFILILTNPEAWAAAYPDCPSANGDINGDGSITFGDINPFIALLTGTP
ncbi:MAG: M28 family peptidase [Phycisphaerae bacterium]|nr:M28 family peptidase [Phycisphaerae bacterium]